MAMPDWPRDLDRARKTRKPNKHRSLLLLAIALQALGLAPAEAAPFGTQQVVGSMKVQSVFKGYYGPIYVTFTPSNLPGCNGGYGGYLTATWEEALGGPPQDLDVKSQLSVLLMAKAMDSTVEVRYRVNTTGTGWDRCTIDAIWLQ